MGNAGSLYQPSEADACRKYVVPRLHGAGWDDDQIAEQRTFTDGRIIVSGLKVQRGPQKRPDYLLRYKPNFMIAVVEAKAEHKDVLLPSILDRAFKGEL